MNVDEIDCDAVRNAIGPTWKSITSMMKDDLKTAEHAIGVVCRHVRSLAASNVVELKTNENDPRVITAVKLAA